MHGVTLKSCDLWCLLEKWVAYGHDIQRPLHCIQQGYEFLFFLFMQASSTWALHYSIFIHIFDIQNYEQEQRFFYLNKNTDPNF